MSASPLTESKKIAERLWDMAKGGLPLGSALEHRITKLEGELQKELGITYSGGSLTLDNNPPLKDGLHAVFEGMGIESSLHSKILMLFQRYSHDCMKCGLWCKQEGEVSNTGDVFVLPTFVRDTKVFPDGEFKKTLVENGTQPILFNKHREVLFDFHDARAEKITNGAKVSAFATLKVGFIRALERCIQERKSECQALLKFFRKYSSYSHLVARKEVEDRVAVYDKHTAIENFYSTFNVLHNARDPKKSVSTDEWLKDPNNLVFYFTALLPSRGGNPKISKTVTSLTETCKVGFALDWKTLRSSVPYVECEKKDTLKEMYNPTLGPNAQYAMRVHQNTGDRQFLLCIKTRNGVDIVVFMTETLFMKFASLKASGTESQVFELDTYLHEQVRYDHPVGESGLCERRSGVDENGKQAGQIVLIAYDAHPVQLYETHQRSTSQKGLLKALGLSEQTMLLHKINDVLTQDVKKRDKIWYSMDEIKLALKQGDLLWKVQEATQKLVKTNDSDEAAALAEVDMNAAKNTNTSSRYGILAKGVEDYLKKIRT